MKIFKYKKSNKGFVILYAVMISSMLLAISLGVANISLKEIGFSTSAVETNEALFAADIGAECALYFDRTNPDNNAFTGTAQMNCAGSDIVLSGSSPYWSFVVSGLGDSLQGCAIVTVDKGTDPTITAIISKGYNIGDASCTSSNSSRVERQLELNYTN